MVNNLIFILQYRDHWVLGANTVCFASSFSDDHFDYDLHPYKLSLLCIAKTDNNNICYASN